MTLKDFFRKVSLKKKSADDNKSIKIHTQGGQWLSGRVLDLTSRGCGLEPHLRHCIVSLSKTLHPLLSTDSTHEELSR